MKISKQNIKVLWDAAKIVHKEEFITIKTTIKKSKKNSNLKLFPTSRT